MGLGQSKRPLVKQIRAGLRVGVRLGGMGIAIGAAVAHSLSADVSNGFHITNSDY